MENFRFLCKYMSRLKWCGVLFVTSVQSKITFVHRSRRYFRNELK